MSQRRRERRVRGLEAVRDDDCAGGYRFRDDIPTKLAAFERTVHDYENQ